MRSVPASQHIDIGVVQPGPRATRLAFLDTDSEDIGVLANCRSPLSRSIPGFNRSPVLMESAAQLYDFICPIDLAHIVESAT